MGWFGVCSSPGQQWPGVFVVITPKDMRVTITRSTIAGGKSAGAGQTVDLHIDEAILLVQMGRAKPAEPEVSKENPVLDGAENRQVTDELPDGQPLPQRAPRSKAARASGTASRDV